MRANATTTRASETPYQRLLEWLKADKRNAAKPDRTSQDEFIEAMKGFFQRLYPQQTEADAIYQSVHTLVRRGDWACMAKDRFIDLFNMVQDKAQQCSLARLCLLQPRYALDDLFACLRAVGDHQLSFVAVQRVLRDASIERDGAGLSPAIQARYIAYLCTHIDEHALLYPYSDEWTSHTLGDTANTDDAVAVSAVQARHDKVRTQALQYFIEQSSALVYPLYHAHHKNTVDCDSKAAAFFAGATKKKIPKQSKSSRSASTVATLADDALPGLYTASTYPTGEFDTQATGGAAAVGEVVPPRLPTDNLQPGDVYPILAWLQIKPTLERLCQVHTDLCTGLRALEVVRSTSPLSLRSGGGAQAASNTHAGHHQLFQPALYERQPQALLLTLLEALATSTTALTLAP